MASTCLRFVLPTCRWKSGNQAYDQVDWNAAVNRWPAGIVGSIPTGGTMFNSNVQPKIRKIAQSAEAWICKSCGRNNGPWLKKCTCGKPRRK